MENFCNHSLRNIPRSRTFARQVACLTQPDCQSPRRPQKTQKAAGTTPDRQTLTSFETEQFLLVLPANRHLLSQLFHRDRSLHGPGKDCMNDFRCEQCQPGNSRDKRMIFADGLGQIDSVPICPGIDQSLPAESPRQIYHQRVNFRGVVLRKNYSLSSRTETKRNGDRHQSISIVQNFYFTHFQLPPSGILCLQFSVQFPVCLPRLPPSPREAGPAGCILRGSVHSRILP